MKLRLICWQRDVSEKALEGNYQRDDVVRLEYKRGICLIDASISRTDRQITAPQAQVDAYLALVQVFFSFSLSVSLLISLSFRLSVDQPIFAFLSLPQDEAIVSGMTSAQISYPRVLVISRWFLMVCFYKIFWMAEHVSHYESLRTR